ncbi:hypothetical protein GCM10012285_03750 [Streptomyces kronopolitis]|uniref:Uncharacterized protein n=2 Tax=Streptomyces kronopolitis TaxID=1612435 RepID=A0ABQ2IZX1_9ACTN|nr:hypothetical protein GCM10012285_03750 [Streptomyces kronopolitis]
MGLLATGLAVAAAAVSTALLLLCVAANLGFQQRADRTDWRSPVKSAAPVATEAVGMTFSGGIPVTVVDVAELPGKKAPAPPGMPRFPKPGEVWVSPALAGRLGHLPSDQRPVAGTPTEPWAARPWPTPVNWSQSSATSRPTVPSPSRARRTRAAPATPSPPPASPTSRDGPWQAESARSTWAWPRSPPFSSSYRCWSWAPPRPVFRSPAATNVWPHCG